MEQKYRFGIDLGTSSIGTAVYKIDEKGNIYFSKSYSADTSNLTGLYYGTGDLGFEKILKEISLELVQDLQAVAPNIRLKR